VFGSPEEDLFFELARNIAAEGLSRCRTRQRKKADDEAASTVVLEENIMVVVV
jgi:hypothetical protein